MDGMGTFTWSPGVAQRGQWKHGEPDGPSVFSYGGKEYAGIYQGGQILEGSGPYVFRNGNIYLGEWKHGLPHGKGVLLGPQGKVLRQGQWKYGICSEK